MIRTCLIQLGRYGDILSILPVAQDMARHEGGKVAMVVCREFMDLMEAVSYVVALAWPGSMKKPFVVANEFSEAFERVVVTQAVADDFPREEVGDSYNMAQWIHAGYIQRWSDPRFRLTLDRRSKEREEALADGFRLRGRPYILVQPSSLSSPFPWPDQLVADVQMSWAKQALVVDMRSVRAKKVQDLLGLIDNAIALVTVDTCTLHLAEASNTPVIALISNVSQWAGTIPRNANVVLSMRYQEYERRKEELNDAIRRLL